MAVTGKIDRKYMAHYIDAGSLCGGLTPKYERLGKDLEEYNVELNPDTETSKNIIGESTFKHNGYEVSSDADPFYADTTSDLFTALQKIVDDVSKTTTLKQKQLKFISGQKLQQASMKHISRIVMLCRSPTAVIHLAIRFRLPSTMLVSV